MPISDIPIFSMLRTKMQWHQERQRVLSENVANADTPGFRARDLAPLKPDRVAAFSFALAALYSAGVCATAAASSHFCRAISLSRDSLSAA